MFCHHCSKYLISKTVLWNIHILSIFLSVFERNCLQQRDIVLAEIGVDHVLWLLPPSNDATRSDLKKLPALPTQALKDHPSLAYWWEITQLSIKLPQHCKRLPLLVFPLLIISLCAFIVLSYSEDRVIEHYKKVNGQSRGQAIVK